MPEQPTNPAVSEFRLALHDITNAGGRAEQSRAEVTIRGGTKWKGRPVTELSKGFVLHLKVGSAGWVVIDWNEVVAVQGCPEKGDR